jgi:hypothetical protein
VINCLWKVFEKGVKRCKKCIACQGRHFEKRPSPHLHKVPTRSNKVSSRTLKMALVFLLRSILILSSQLCFSLPRDSLPSGIPNKILYSLLISPNAPMPVTCPFKFTLLYLLISVMILGEEYRLWEHVIM